MRGISFVLLTTLVGIGMTIAAPKAEAQVAVNIGPPPECPYGYFPEPPYACAPYGYYGPEWFSDGIFIGAGPWFHGRDDFHGHVDNHFRRDHGYHGRYPDRGERADRGRVNADNFHGNEMRDGRGHVVQGGHGGHEKH